MAIKDWKKTYSGNNIQRWRHKNNYWPEIEISKPLFLLSYTKHYHLKNYQKDIKPKKAKTFYLVTITGNKSFKPIFRDKFKTKKAALNFVKSYMRKH